jgi:hypothetical protein
MNDLWVMGPHSSGTRLATRLVASSGIAAHHYTFPHADWWPEDPVVWVTRDPVTTAASMLINGHVESITEGLDAVVRANTHWVDHRDDDDFHITYEEILLDTRDVIERLAEHLILPYWKFDEEIADGNEKYLNA